MEEPIYDAVGNKLKLRDHVAYIKWGGLYHGIVMGFTPKQVTILPGDYIRDYAKDPQGFKASFMDHQYPTRLAKVILPE